MMMGKSMPSPSSMSSKSPMSSMPSDDSEGSDEDSEDQGDNKSSKLLAMQNLLDGLSDLVSDDMKPYIDQAKQAMHLAHESAEGDQMGVDEAEEHEGMPSKSGLDVTIGMGGKPPMDAEEDDEEPKKGFLAILAKKMKSK